MPSTSSSVQSQESLREISKEIQELAFRLNAVVDAMKDGECPALRVDKYASLTLGMSKVQIFVDRAVASWREWRDEHGHFRADRRKPKPPK